MSEDTQNVEVITESVEETDLQRLDNRVHRQFAPQGLEYTAGSITWVRKLLIAGVKFSLLC